VDFGKVEGEGIWEQMHPSVDDGILLRQGGDVRRLQGRATVGAWLQGGQPCASPNTFIMSFMVPRSSSMCADCTEKLSIHMKRIESPTTKNAATNDTPVTMLSDRRSPSPTHLRHLNDSAAECVRTLPSWHIWIARTHDCKIAITSNELRKTNRDCSLPLDYPQAHDCSGQKTVGHDKFMGTSLIP